MCECECAPYGRSSFIARQQARVTSSNWDARIKRARAAFMSRIDELPRHSSIGRIICPLKNLGYPEREWTSDVELVIVIGKINWRGRIWVGKTIAAL